MQLTDREMPPLRLYGAMSVSATPSSLSPNHRFQMQYYSKLAFYAEQHSTLAKYSLRLLKARHPELKHKNYYIPTPEEYYHSNKQNHSLYVPPTDIHNHNQSPGSKHFYQHLHQCKECLNMWSQVKIKCHSSRFKDDNKPQSKILKCPYLCGKAFQEQQLLEHSKVCSIYKRQAGKQINGRKSKQSKEYAQNLYSLYRKKQQRTSKKADNVPKPLKNEIVEEQENHIPTRVNTRNGNYKCSICHRVFPANVGLRHEQFCQLSKQKEIQAKTPRRRILS